MVKKNIRSFSMCNLIESLIISGCQVSSKKYTTRNIEYIVLQLAI